MWCCRGGAEGGRRVDRNGEALMENLVVCGFGGWQVVTHRNQNSGRTMSQEVSGQPASHQAQVLPQAPRPLAGVPEVLGRPVSSTGDIVGVELSVSAS